MRPVSFHITQGEEALTSHSGLALIRALEPGALDIMDRAFIDFARLCSFTEQAASL